MRAPGLIDHLHEDEFRQSYTVMVLFDDTIDAESSLMSLRRSKQPASEVSVIFREQVLDMDSSIPYRAVLSVVVAKSALEVVGSWLQGLASLILPDRATYLAAGPIGAILATLRDTRTHTDDGDRHSAPRRNLPTRQLTRAFQAFGFEHNEAAYVEQRVVAGAPLIAVTSHSIETLRVAHEIFSQNQPVYIGLTPTDAALAAQATHLLTTGPRGTGAVVIADAVSPLIHLHARADLYGSGRDIRSRAVISNYGESIGRIEDVLFEAEPDSVPDQLRFAHVSDESLLIRYIIVRVGRRLGRHRIAIPSERVSITSEGVIASIAYEELISAPRYATGAQLSRQDEASIRRHFNEPYYWITSDES